jgi:hypothetical protein
MILSVISPNIVLQEVGYFENSAYPYAWEGKHSTLSGKGKVILLQARCGPEGG